MVYSLFGVFGVVSPLSHCGFGALHDTQKMAIVTIWMYEH